MLWTSWQSGFPRRIVMLPSKCRVNFYLGKHLDKASLKSLRTHVSGKRRSIRTSEKQLTELRAQENSALPDQIKELDKRIVEIERRIETLRAVRGSWFGVLEIPLAAQVEIHRLSTRCSPLRHSKSQLESLPGTILWLEEDLERQRLRLAPIEAEIALRLEKDAAAKHVIMELRAAAAANRKQHRGLGEP
jgi:chromosome segregation ATPase